MSLFSPESSKVILANENTCAHCGEICEADKIHNQGKDFCCQGCQTVYDILYAHELGNYYQLETRPGTQMSSKRSDGRLDYLDVTEIQARLIEYRDGHVSHVSFSIPQMHCTSCVWLLEHLHKLNAGIISSRVNFLRRELSLSFLSDQLSLKELVALLAHIGYEPDIRLDSQQKKPKASKSNRDLLFRMGVAGFCFGNIMLLSFPEYLGLDGSREADFAFFFSSLGLILSLPVLLYSSSLFFRSAWQSMRQGFLNLDVPVSLGILALFGRSSFEILSGTGTGYLDSLAGLVFLLLIGKWIQRLTYDSLAFDRDYASYFPLAATKLIDGEGIPILVSDLKSGDEILVRNQELIPADAILLSDRAQVDFSFVTGESDPVEKKEGDQIYAGGRQMGGTIRLLLSKAASQSYLTRLWNHDSFQKEEQETIRTLADRLSRYFTAFVLTIASLAGLYWVMTAGIGPAVEVFTAVLIVACPCGLALTAPITLGAAMRWLGKTGLYLQSASVIERLAEIDHVIFDKTGTLSISASEKHGLRGDYDRENLRAIRSLAHASLHPVSQALDNYLGEEYPFLPVFSFVEENGMGIRGRVGQHVVAIGKRVFVEKEEQQLSDSGTWISVDGRLMGNFDMGHAFRPGLKAVLNKLHEAHQLSVLSGDVKSSAALLQPFLPLDTETHFAQSPADKLDYVEAQQQKGAHVLMIGDGLNDAGAFQQSDVGIAITDSKHRFVPACDAMLDADQFQQLPKLLDFSKGSMKLVRVGLLISLLYNLVGLAVAVQGLLSPLFAAVLMPLSSLTIVAFGLVSTAWLARRERL